MFTSNTLPSCTNSSDQSAAAITSPQTWISVAEASSLMHQSSSIVIKRIESGSVCGRIPDDLPFTYNGEQNYVVLLLGV